MSKLIYQRGNLYTGDPYGVVLDIGWFGSTELHGPFNGENAAHTYAVEKVLDRDDVTNGQVVRINLIAEGDPIIDNEDERQEALRIRAARKEAS